MQYLIKECLLQFVHLGELFRTGVIKCPTMVQIQTQQNISLDHTEDLEKVIA